MSEIKYRRVMLKVSGEALAGEARRGLDFDVIHSVCEAIKQCVDMGVQVGLMVGAGNFWRGVKDGADKMQRSHADSMGMLGTVMNCIAVADAFEKIGVEKIKTTGEEFDPNLHEAVMHIDDDELGENVVAEELRSGYIYKETVDRKSTRLNSSHAWRSRMPSSA